MNNSSLLNPDQWVNLYADALYGYTLPRVNDAALAEDLVQETFLSAWKARDSFKGEASEKSWLFAICKHKIIDHYRKKARDIVQPMSQRDASDGMFDEAEHWAKETRPTEWGIDYQQQIDNKEFNSILNLCKKKLQQLQQSVFVMKYMEDLDSAEICKALGITPSNYWVLIHRAKLQLRTCLEKNWISLK
ncbi:MAG: sigma-70 family RNA polymerase sigma factor [Sediminibacterium sp.]